MDAVLKCSLQEEEGILKGGSEGELQRLHADIAYRGC